MILMVLSDWKNNPLDDEIFLNYLSFFTKLLEGGNKKIQKTVYEYFKTIPRSEFIFEKFFYVLSEQIDFLKQKNHNEIEEEFQKIIQTKCF